MDRICTTLQGAGHEVALVGRLLPESPTLPPRPYRQHRLRCRYHTGKRFYVEFNLRLWHELRRWEYEVICSVDLDTLLAGYFLTRGSARLALDAHEWFSETPEVCERPAIRRAWRTLGRVLVPQTDARYTVAPVIGQRMSADYGVPFSVVRNLPYRQQVLKSETSEGVIVYQGMLNPGRGLEFAITALTYLPTIKLWIIGDGPGRSDLESLAHALSVNDRVWFVGFVPPAELPELTRRAWLGINLLAGDSASYYYSLANKALDYVQAGLPSVQMDYPEYRAINDAHHCFALLPALSAPALAELIQALMDNPLKYERLRDACQGAGEVLCWEAEASKLLAIFQGLERP